MGKGIFVAGTDTGVGKTVMTGLLARFLCEKGVNVITQKWVQTGCQVESNDIRQHCTIAPCLYERVALNKTNIEPYVLNKPCSPHLAAEKEQKRIDPERIKRAFRELDREYDQVLVEGAGGILVPLREDLLLADLVGDMELDVVVTVGNKLGAINHTLLTFEALKARGLKILGTLYNDLPGEDPEILKDNKRIIAKISGVKTLAEIGYEPRMELLYQRFKVFGDNIMKVIKGR